MKKPGGKAVDLYWHDGIFPTDGWTWNRSPRSRLHPHVEAKPITRH